MTLPANGAAWPPRSIAPLYADIVVDDAWYSGDADRLAKVYRHGPQHRKDGRRRLWGRHPQPGKREQRLHIPLAGEIAQTSADLLFADTPVITTTDTAAQDRLDELLDVGGVAELLLTAAETAAALSGVFLRVTWDRDAAPDRPLLTVVHPDQAVPEWRFGIMTAVTFWRALPSTGSAVWRHLERHEPGTILHGLYEGTDDQLGRRVPLTEHPETARLAASLGAEGDAITTGVPMITAVYVPNIGPNRKHRGAPWGRSDLQGVHDLLDALDETWSSWLRDIRLARARLIVPDGYLRSTGAGKGAIFDDDREVWQTLAIPPTEQGNGITLSQFAIRVEEHRTTADAIVRQATTAAGYSPTSLGLDGDGAAVTATEIAARDHRSMVTRGKKVRYWRRAIADILYVLLAVDRAQFAGKATPERPTVDFGSGVAEDPGSTAQTLSLLAQAQAVSTDTKVRILHPDWADEAVAKEVDRILAETGQAAPDPVGTFPL
ncbi:phage portal protein [Streptomyces sp. RKAG293]|uniref:phage portal protein n=1 Tax=Streptomyces sp. RKAG293 TaxID=2893403 RepID=UPI0020340575|nr:phage portal protein [Streptomyces sp. RKAG293]MCM2420298.1 phage portal protein [Streptomyces sp. RKAG293]